MRILLDFGEAQLEATLDDTPTGRDFRALLPLTLSLGDHAGTEKVADLPRPLSTDGAPPGTDAAAGDLAHYVPWGNLAIFYRPFRYAEGLVRLGHIHDGVERLAGMQGPIDVTITSLDDQQG